jgi:hypothetical protein
MKKQFVRVGSFLAGAAALAATSAHAALDTAVTTAITTAQTDMSTLYSTLTGAGVALWVLRIIYKKFVIR